MFWLMDTECCSECGCILIYGEVGMCQDCWEDALRAAEEHEFDDVWFYEDEED